MILNELKGKVNEMEMPDDMRARIVKNCCLKIEEESMRKHKKNRVFRKPVMGVASLVLCIGMTGFTVIAVADKRQGFFKDITDWRGAVIGTVYQQATEEVQVKIIEATEQLKVEVTFLTPDELPYLTSEQMGIHTANIIDQNGEIIMKDISSEAIPVQNGKVVISISLANVPSGNYKLQISELVSFKKADQPLVLSGDWGCEFVRS